tara:strand:- start:4840 stop:5127 length:288 start_codon:yes stop_codon:yes gene_type:complete
MEELLYLGFAFAGGFITVAILKAAMLKDAEAKAVKAAEAVEARTLAADRMNSREEKVIVFYGDLTNDHKRLLANYHGVPETSIICKPSSEWSGGS